MGKRKRSGKAKSQKRQKLDALAVPETTNESYESHEDWEATTTETYNIDTESFYSEENSFDAETQQSADDTVEQGNEHETNEQIDQPEEQQEETYSSWKYDVNGQPTTNKKSKKSAKRSTRNRKKRVSCPAHQRAFTEDELAEIEALDLPQELYKYYAQRYRLWSRYDEGIQMDHTGWYSVTPEKIAEHVALKCRHAKVIVDGFCGVGGNTVQFAKYCERVIAIDLDPTRIMQARNNARVYGVEDKIEFICGDFFQVLPTLTNQNIDIVFLSPPWGGPDYVNTAVFDVKTMIPGDGELLFTLARQMCPNVVYMLPKNTSMFQLAGLAAAGELCEVEANYLSTAQKTLTAYYGPIFLQSL